MKKVWQTTLLFLGGLMLLLGGTAPLQASPVQWSLDDGGNGHWYEAVSSDGISWDAAKTAATNAGGYLATITSGDENTFVFKLVDDQTYWDNRGWGNLGPWLGGYYTGADGSMNGSDWAWVNGDTWSYANWSTGEPNFPDEKNIHFIADYDLYPNEPKPNRQPYWNNVAGTESLKGYVVEYNHNPVPLPGAFWLLFSGLAVLVTGRRRPKGSN